MKIIQGYIVIIFVLLYITSCGSDKGDKGREASVNSEEGPKFQANLSLEGEHKFKNHLTTGESATQEFTFLNRGELRLNIRNIVVQKGNNTFILDKHSDCLQKDLDKNNRCTFQLLFRSMSPGDHEALIKVELTTPTGQAKEKLFSIRAKVIPALPSVLKIKRLDFLKKDGQKSGDFGQVFLCDVQRALFRVTNTGSSFLFASDLEVTGISNATVPFSLLQNGCALKTVLAPHESCHLEIAFTPKIPGPASGQLKIGKAPALFVFDLQGTGSVSAAGKNDLTLSDVTGQFAEVTVGKSVSRKINIQNSSGEKINTLTLKGGGFVLPFKLVMDPSATSCGSLQKDLDLCEKCYVTVTYTPLIDGLVSNNSLTISGTGQSSQKQITKDISISGSGKNPTAARQMLQMMSYADKIEDEIAAIVIDHTSVTVPSGYNFNLQDQFKKDLIAAYNNPTSTEKNNDEPPLIGSVIKTGHSLKFNYTDFFKNKNKFPGSLDIWDILDKHAIRVIGYSFRNDNRSPQMNYLSCPQEWKEKFEVQYHPSTPDLLITWKNKADNNCGIKDVGGLYPNATRDIYTQILAKLQTTDTKFTEEINNIFELSHHLGSGYLNSPVGFISTTRSFNVAKGWTGKWIYAVLGEGGFDVVAMNKVNPNVNNKDGTSKSFSLHPNEKEIAVPGAIPWDDIVAYREKIIVGSKLTIYVRKGLEKMDPKAFHCIVYAMAGGDQMSKTHKYCDY